MSTPMLRQYKNIKDKYKDELLFYRLGDFYELFFEDAKKASDILNIVLTKKKTKSIDVPMCGVPFHSADGYIARLIDKGYHVAICEQTQNPKDVKGIVNREVVRVVTPGTITDLNQLEGSVNNFIISIFHDKNINIFGIAVIDITTGEFLTTEIVKGNSSSLFDEIAKLKPKEIIVNNNFPFTEKIKEVFNIIPIKRSEKKYSYRATQEVLLEHFKLISLDIFGIENETVLIRSSGGLIDYLLETQKNSLSHINKLKRYSIDNYMLLDISSRRNLELTQPLDSTNKNDTLLNVLNSTLTPMGGRKLTRYIEQPLTDKMLIEDRLSGVDFFYNNYTLRYNVQNILKKIKDVERLVGRLTYNIISPKEIYDLKNTLLEYPKLIRQLDNTKNKTIDKGLESISDFSNLISLIDSALNSDSSLSLKEGNFIKIGYSNELDEVINIKRNGTKLLLALEEKERNKTKINNLKIKYNKIFGYYFEVTNSNKKLVPEYFIRKQTLANCERYIVEELEQLEEMILTADEKIFNMEWKIFNNLKIDIEKYTEKLQKSSNVISEIDILQCFAEVAERNNYVKPIIGNDGNINIIGGRHPVVERKESISFIPNDLLIDDNNTLSVITGPNMSGKSTYMRQNAIILIMAQIGSYVPATTATITPVDKIFTRIGASDSLATGQSTFMVEMSEVANILENATKNSFLIIDEIGRGTSTFDGLSIAWSVLEYIADNLKLGAKTLFATHYHELTELEGKVSRVKNYSVAINDNIGGIVFLHKIIEGPASQSYGIHVAKLAGIPLEVIKRAEKILKFLERTNKIHKDVHKNRVISYTENNVENKELEKGNKIIKELENINIDNLTPMDALQILYKLKNLK